MNISKFFDPEKIKNLPEDSLLKTPQLEIYDEVQELTKNDLKELFDKVKAREIEQARNRQEGLRKKGTKW